jgi:hypothetical protein
MYAKFRIWDEKYNCWSKESILCYPGEELKKQGRVIQWYTDFEDKDGTEICEGDIIEWGDKLYVATWDEVSRSWQAVVPYDSYFKSSIIAEYFRDMTNGKIVGNIFELPCSKPNAFDHNGECLTCDAWATDCPFLNGKVK